MTAASQGVKRDRLWQRHLALSAFGRRSDGGANRPALGSDDLAARAAIAGWASERGFEVAMDAIGNFHVTRAGDEPALAPVQTGSHLDTQPAGGHFDGVYGVLAGFEVLEALEDLGIATRRSVRVTSWTNEEGVRFSPPLMGSGVFSGAVRLEDMLPITDVDGITVRTALETMREGLPRGVLALDKVEAPAAYVEAHIEQGPVLESDRLEIGIVTDVVGIRQFRLQVKGEAGHAGTVPMDARCDALAGAVRLTSRLFDTIGREAGDLRFTIGRFEVRPGGPSTIPDDVMMVIDVRSADEARLDNIEAALRAACEHVPAPAAAALERLAARPPVRFDPALVARVENAAAALDRSHRRLPSGAGHDAMLVASLCPTAMLFIPCRDGISHNIRESATAAHMAAGAQVLADVLAELACE